MLKLIALAVAISVTSSLALADELDVCKNLKPGDKLNQILCDNAKLAAVYSQVAGIYDGEVKAALNERPTYKAILQVWVVTTPKFASNPITFTRTN